ncbi:MAG TPA: hypothetical protein VGN20_20605 [Mucilaginibacter sp.]|jgi:hypothetical protein
MSLPVNALVNIPLTTGTISVFIKGEVFDWRSGATSIQWYEITANANQVWNKNPNNPGDQTAVFLSTLAASNAYRALSNTAQLAQVTAAVQAYYNNLQGIAAGTIQPVLS